MTSQKIYIVVTGPFSSGKTSFMKAVYAMSDKPVEGMFKVDRGLYSTGLAQDFVKIDTAYALFYFISSPGARRFDSMLEGDAGRGHLRLRRAGR